MKTKVKVSTKIKIAGALGVLGLSLIGMPQGQGQGQNTAKVTPSPKMSLTSSSGQIMYFTTNGNIVAIDPATDQQIGSFAAPAADNGIFAIAQEAPIIAYMSSGTLYTATISPTGLSNITSTSVPSGPFEHILAINQLGTEIIYSIGSSGDTASQLNFYAISIPSGKVVASITQNLAGAYTPHFQAAGFDNNGNVIGSYFSSNKGYIYTWNLSNNTTAPLANGGVYSGPSANHPAGAGIVFPNRVAPNSGDLIVTLINSAPTPDEDVVTDPTASNIIPTPLAGSADSFSPNGQQVIVENSGPAPLYPNVFTIENINGTGQTSLPAAAGDYFIGWTANYQIPVAPGGNGAPCTSVFPAGGVVAASNSPSGNGYYEVDSKGDVAAFGDAACYGSLAGTALNKPIVGMAVTPDGKGYYLVASDGGIFSFGDAKFQGSTGAMTLNKPIVGMSIDQNTGGYWLVASDGGIFSFNAPFYGSTGAMTLNKPIVAMAPYNNGQGYWLVASDGGIFSFNAPFYGSMGGTPLNKPVVGMAPSADGKGYYLVASDGGIFSFNVPFYGSTGNIVLNKPIVAMAVMPGNGGYRFMASDGGVFDYGTAQFYGSGAL